MIDEEKKSMERCNELTKPVHSSWIGISNQIAIKIVLSLIKKQEKVINEATKHIADVKGQTATEWKEYFFKMAGENEKANSKNSTNLEDWGEFEWRW